MQEFKPPVLIDEVKKAPELFEYIKKVCDETEEPGMFWLTGSESKKLIKEAGDSLAGRICILRMYSLSLKEKQRISNIGGFPYSSSELIGRESKFPKADIIIEENGALHPIEI